MPNTSDDFLVQQATEVALRTFDGACGHSGLGACLPCHRDRIVLALLKWGAKRADYERFRITRPNHDMGILTTEEQRRLAEELERKIAPAIRITTSSDLLHEQLAAIDKAISDSGIVEQDCTLPLAERVANIIMDMKGAEYNEGLVIAELKELEEKA